MKIRERTSYGIVFTKFRIREDRPPLNYGCLFRVGTIRRLPAQCCEERFDLEGRYVAWVTRGSAIGDEVDDIGVYDLRRGRPKELGGGREYVSTMSYVTDFVVKRNGSIAWIEAAGTPDAPQPGYEVHEVSAEEGTGEKVIDAGKIEPRSLKLIDRRHSIRWIKDGVSRSAPLR